MKTTFFRVVCKRCGKFNTNSIPIPEENQVLESCCGDCDFMLGEFYLGEMEQIETKKN